jgi:hypothetical protein
MSIPKVWQDDEGIVRAEYPADCHVTMKEIKSEYRKRCRISRDEQLLLVIVKGLLDFDIDARQFLADEEHTAITRAAAIVIPHGAEYPVLSKYFAESLKTMHRAPFPIKIFHDEAPAVEWLKEQA